jgi:hypothetical protein
MPYVMVPVPEEHVLDVMRYVTRLARSHEEGTEEWDAESVERLFEESNELSRSLLSFLAHPRRAGQRVTPPDIAEALELRLADFAGIVGPLSRQFRKWNKVPLFESTVENETTPSGRQVKKRTFTITEEHAQLVRAAEQAVRDREPHPLLDERS